MTALYKQTTPRANADSLLLLMNEIPTYNHAYIQSVIAQLNRKGSVSDKQHFHLWRLNEQAKANAAKKGAVESSTPVANSQVPASLPINNAIPISSYAPTYQSTTVLPGRKIGKVSKIIDLFNMSAKKLKNPKIRFYDEETEQCFFLVLPKNTRYRGEYLAIYTQRYSEYIGKMTYDGEFIPFRGSKEKTRDIVEANLKELAQFPIEKVRAYGHKFNHCCFCGKELSDAESVKMGYGPICAKHFGLPHDYAGLQIYATASFSNGVEEPVVVEQLELVKGADKG